LLNYREQLRGKYVTLATAHNKEVAIANILQTRFAVRVVVPTNFNTDQFGTFSGEIAREGTPVETARKKIEAACKLTGHSIAIASEGSFGPHPEIPFVPANEEWLVWRDETLGLEVVHRHISFNTNHAQVEANTTQQVNEFLTQIGFPQHGVIAKRNDGTWLKGLHDTEQIQELIRTELNAIGALHLETDMRAMHNPTRMDVIREATNGLIKRLESCCPKCAWPDFTVSHAETGLCCELCGEPTSITKSWFYHCNRCGYEVEERFPNGPKAKAIYCYHCNP
jgi:sulfur carrier protein ThiS